MALDGGCHSLILGMPLAANYLLDDVSKNYSDVQMKYYSIIIAYPCM